MATDAIPGTGPVLYAFTLGLVAALNPCGFPMLPAYLALFAAPRSGARGAGVTRGLLAGTGVSVGFVAVFGALGLVLESGAQIATGWLPDVMAAVGVVMAGTGIFTLFGHAPALRLPAPQLGSGRSVLAMAAYGVTYAVGSLSCSLPLFLAAVAGSFTVHSVPVGLATYFAYALGMALFVTGVAVVTSTAGAVALGNIGAARRFIPAVSGVTLTLSGTYLAYYWISESVDAAGTSPVTATLTRVQGGMASAMADRPLLTAVALGAVVLVAIALMVRRSLATVQEKPDQSPSVNAKGPNAS